MPASNQPPQSNSDKRYISSLRPSVIEEFRDFIYTRHYIDRNAKTFLTNDWIVVADLKEYIETKPSSPDSDDLTAVASSSPFISRSSTPFLSQTGATVKVEEEEQPKLVTEVNDVRTRTISENGQEVTEILSDSEEENEMKKEEDHRSHYEMHGFEDYQPVEWEVSETNWEVPGKHSTVCIGPKAFRITECVSAERLERLDFLPPTWPIPETPTAFLLDLSDKKFEVYNERGIRLGPDYLLRRKDNDSWDTQSTGSHDSQVWVRFEPDQEKILCRRVRLKCKGVCACAEVDRKLLQVERRDLDVSTREAVFTAQQQARQIQGTTQRSSCITFLNVVRSKKCRAKDAEGNACSGEQIMIPIKGSDDDYFFGCNGWKTTFKNNHSTHSIPKNIDRTVLAHLIKTNELPPGLRDDSPPCSTIVHPSTGLKQKFCESEHVKDGVSVRSRIVRYPCEARCTIFVPLDEAIRKALLIFPKNTPHNHPVSPFRKLGHDDVQDYTACVIAAGPVGATVQRVDTAASTSVILNGQTPAERAPGLQDGRKRREILHKVKLKNNPAGLGLGGAANLYFRDQDRPVQDRYVHRFITLPGGGVVIFTGYAELLALIHDVTSFEADTTFKRIADDVNELEVVIFYKPAQRAITIARIYVNRADTTYFKLVFDTLQEVVLEVTGKPMRFKRLSAGGNLLVMNSDMEAAQILGAGLSFLPTNEPDYSGITTTEPDVLVQYFLKLCLVHFKRAILDFRSLLSQLDYQRLMNLPSLKSQAELEEFDRFIASLKLKKVSDWWAHKTMHRWIIPCIMRSQSMINTEDWDATPDVTNTGEAQHHWTNKMTGIGLTVVDGLESARIADDSVRRSLDVTRKTGILTNNHNEYQHRLSRNTTQRSTAASNAREGAAEADAASQLQAELKALQEEKKQKEAQLKALRASVPTRKGKKSKALDSSSGRVASSQPILTPSVSELEKEDVPVTSAPQVHEEYPPPAPAPALSRASVLTELNICGDSTFIPAVDPYQLPTALTEGGAAGTPEMMSDNDFAMLMNDPGFLAMLNDNSVFNEIDADSGFPHDIDPSFRVPFEMTIDDQYPEWPTLPPVPLPINEDGSPSSAVPGSTKRSRVHRNEVDEGNILEQGTVRARTKTFKLREGAEGPVLKRPRY